MSKTLFEHYAAIMQFGNLAFDTNGYAYDIRRSDKDRKDYIMAANKRVALPTIDILKQPDEGDVMLFHPFAEEAHKGESPIFAMLRTYFARTLADAISGFMSQMVMLASSAESPVVLDARQQDGVRLIKDCSASVGEEVVRIIMASMQPRGQRKTERIQLYLSRKAKIDGVNYLRSLTVRFPLYELVLDQLKIKKAERSVYNGMKPSDAALKVLKALYEYLFPRLKDALDAYSTGSNSEIAPYSDALLKGTAELTACINEAVDIYAKIGEFKESRLDDGWVDAVAALPSLHREIILIPAAGDAAGLEGLEEKMAREQSVMHNTPPPVHTPAPTVPSPAIYQQPMPAQQVQQAQPAQSAIYQQPVAAPVQPAQVASGKSNFADLVAAQSMQGYQQPQVYQQPVVQPQVQMQVQIVQATDQNGRPLFDPHTGQPVLVQQQVAVPMQQVQYAPAYDPTLPSYMQQGGGVPGMAPQGPAPAGQYNPHNRPQQPQAVPGMMYNNYPQRFN